MFYKYVLTLQFAVVRIITHCHLLLERGKWLFFSLTLILANKTLSLLILKPDKVVFNLRFRAEVTPNTNKYLTKPSDETTSFDLT